MVRLTSILLFDAGGAGAAESNPGLPRSPGPGYVIVPHVAGDVVVPLDQPARSIPAPAPGQAAPTPELGDVGYLRVEVEPAAAAIFVNGEYVATAGDLGAAGLLLILPTGRHQVDALLPGWKPLRAVVELLPDQSAALRARLEPDTGVRPQGVVRDGYFVVPPAAREPENAPEGGGYFVVPPAAQERDVGPQRGGSFVVPPAAPERKTGPQGGGYFVVPPAAPEQEAGPQGGGSVATPPARRDPEAVPHGSGFQLVPKPR